MRKILFVLFSVLSFSGGIKLAGLCFWEVPILYAHLTKVQSADWHGPLLQFHGSCRYFAVCFHDNVCF
jgi:hypothetical protein